MSIEIPQIDTPEKVFSKLMPFVKRLGIDYKLGDSLKDRCEQILRSLDATWKKPNIIRPPIVFGFRGAEQSSLKLQRASEYNRYKPASKDSEFLLLTNADGFVCVYCWLAAKAAVETRRTLLFFDPGFKFSNGRYTNDYKADYVVSSICTNAWSNDGEASLCHCLLFIFFIWFDLNGCRGNPTAVSRGKLDDKDAKLALDFKAKNSLVLQLYMFNAGITKEDREVLHAPAMRGLPQRKAFAATTGLHCPDNIQWERYERQAGGNFGSFLRPYPSEHAKEYLANVLTGEQDPTADNEPDPNNPVVINRGADHDDKLPSLSKLYRYSTAHLVKEGARTNPLFRKTFALSLLKNIQNINSKLGMNPAELAHNVDPANNRGGWYEPGMRGHEEESYISYKELDKSKTYIVIGDIHGGLPCLVRCLYRLKFAGIINDGGTEPEAGWKVAERYVLVFTGDLLDRGGYSWEVGLIVLLLYKQNIENVILVRGNHDAIYFRADGSDPAFDEEVAHKLVDVEQTFRALTPFPADDKDDINVPDIPRNHGYDNEGDPMYVEDYLMYEFKNTFRYFPSAAVIQDESHRLYFCHGGFDPGHALKPKDFKGIEKISGPHGMICRWMDFKPKGTPEPGNSRPTYPTSAIHKWLNDNGVSAVVRGHQDTYNFSLWARSTKLPPECIAAGSNLFVLKRDTCLDALSSVLGDHCYKKHSQATSHFTLGINVDLAPRDPEVFLPIITQSTAHVQIAQMLSDSDSVQADSFLTLSFQNKWDWGEAVFSANLNAREPADARFTLSRAS